MRRFFAMLECAVNNIATNGYSGQFAVKPKPDLQLNEPLNSSSSVFKKDETVYKFYDLRRLDPQIEVMEMIENGYFPMERHYLTEDQMSYAYYTSDYIKPKEKNKLTLKDFEPIMLALDQLHDKFYVDSDIQAANILFPEDSEAEAKLIDFDLADRENTAYPDGYNSIEERHEDARAGKPRSRFHDQYSIAYIIKQQKFFSDFTAEQKSTLLTVISGEHTGTLRDIYSQLCT